MSHFCGRCGHCYIFSLYSIDTLCQTKLSFLGLVNKLLSQLVGSLAYTCCTPFSSYPYTLMRSITLTAGMLFVSIGVGCIKVATEDRFFASYTKSNLKSITSKSKSSLRIPSQAPSYKSSPVAMIAAVGTR